MMINHLRWYRFAALAVAILLAVGVGASPAGGKPPISHPTMGVFALKLGPG